MGLSRINIETELNQYVYNVILKLLKMVRKRILSTQFAVTNKAAIYLLSTIVVLLLLIFLPFVFFIFYWPHVSGFLNPV